MALSCWHLHGGTRGSCPIGSGGWKLPQPEAVLKFSCGYGMPLWGRGTKQTTNGSFAWAIALLGMLCEISSSKLDLSPLCFFFSFFLNLSSLKEQRWHSSAIFISTSQCVNQFSCLHLERASGLCHVVKGVPGMCHARRLPWGMEQLGLHSPHYGSCLENLGCH